MIRKRQQKKLRHEKGQNKVARERTKEKGEKSRKDKGQGKGNRTGTFPPPGSTTRKTFTYYRLFFFSLFLILSKTFFTIFDQLYVYSFRRLML